MMENRMASYNEVGNSSNSKSKSNSKSNSNSIHPNTKSSFGFMMESSSWNSNTMMSMIESRTTNNNNNNNNKEKKSIMQPTSAEDKACKTHKEAERRRRKRINAHLATLRTLLPGLIKTDKASVLAEVVRRVRELTKARNTIPSGSGSGGSGYINNNSNNNNNNNNNSCLFPGDSDEVRLQRSENDNNTLIATLCCEDRPELIVDLTRALRSVKAKVLRAEIATVGGRTITVLSVCGVACGAPEGLLRRALKVVADKPSSSSSAHAHAHAHAHGLRMIMSPPS